MWIQVEIEKLQKIRFDEGGIAIDDIHVGLSARVVSSFSSQTPSTIQFYRISTILYIKFTIAFDAHPRAPSHFRAFDLFFFRFFLRAVFIRS